MEVLILPVIEVVIDRMKYYACGECYLIYREKSIAEECETWCSKNKSCNEQITSNSIGYLKFKEAPSLQI